MALGEKKEQVERDIMSVLVTFQKGSRDLLSTVSIHPLAEQSIDGKDDLPFQKAPHSEQTAQERRRKKGDRGSDGAGGGERRRYREVSGADGRYSNAP